jgi:hypothetical protein
MLLAVACSLAAQTMARPGWTASGLSAEPWWKHAVFYQIPQPAAVSAIAYAGAGDAPVSSMDWMDDAKTITAKLTALQSLGVDAVILPMPAQQTAQAASDAFDELMRQASQRGVHILLDLPTSATSADIPAQAHLWLGRGVSGFVVTPSPGDANGGQPVVQLVRKITNAAVGGRIVLLELPPEPTDVSAVVVAATRYSGATSTSHAAELTAPQLQIDARFGLPAAPDAWALRDRLKQEEPEANVLLDLPPATSSASHGQYDLLARTIAALMLTTRPAALVDADELISQPAGGAATADWYRQLIALHHSNATLRYGSATMLDFDAQHALVWVSRASAGTGQALPVVVVCNLSSSPITLSLSAAVKGLNLHGSFLQTLLRTDSGMGPQDLNAVMVPAYGVYIGELRR